MSVPELELERERPAEVLAGFLAVLSVVAGALAWLTKPALLAPFALLLAFVATAMARRRSEQLVKYAVWWAALSWVAGMTIAVITKHPLF